MFVIEAFYSYRERVKFHEIGYSLTAVWVSKDYSKEEEKKKL